MTHEEQKRADEFSSAQWAEVDKLIESHKGKPGALIPVLEKVQMVTGYLPEVVQHHVARGLDIPLAHVYGVVTFYSFFTMKPRGKHQIRICTGTACHVRGSHRNMEKIKETLGISPGDCTEDRLFSLEEVRCLGACGLAPVLVVGQDTHKQVKESKLNEIIGQYAHR